ncbi:MAG TPA: transposase [Ignavibacteriaceae bacterium]|nr:transposase [Ignavibacteriaceae bacterium]
MFKPNTEHTQTNMFGFSNFVSSNMLKELQESEQMKFYELIFRNIKEEDFACLYSEIDSRPNAPINCMVSALLIMNKQKLTYERLFENIKFNLLTKIALGLQTLDEVPFSEATIFNFQNRLSGYFIQTGENLLEKAFDHLTKKQLKELKIKTDIQRTDSFQTASNIRKYTRLQLLVEMLIRIHRIITEEDQRHYEELFSPYVKKTSGQFLYRLSSEDIPTEYERIGKVYKGINDNLKPRYSDLEIFQIFERVYSEHFTMAEEKVQIKASEELTSSMIQSPDDIEATYRKKGGKEFYGQTVNIVETCNPDNQLNLITDLSVHANNIDDSKGLNERIDTIKEKTPELKELHFDGAYSSKGNDIKFEDNSITPVQTAIRGIKPSGVEIKIEKTDEQDNHNDSLKYLVCCPNQTVYSQFSRKRFKAEFDLSICCSCTLASVCQLKTKKKSRVYYYTPEEYLKRKRLEVIQKIPKERRSLRTNIEATVSEFTRKMNNRKLKVRGLFKAQLFAYSVGITVNFGRIYRYLTSPASAATT